MEETQKNKTLKANDVFTLYFNPHPGSPKCKSLGTTTTIISNDIWIKINTFIFSGKSIESQGRLYYK